MVFERNPNDEEIVGCCADTLQKLYDSIIRRNREVSKHESTMVTLQGIILKLRKLQNYIR